MPERETVWALIGLLVGGVLFALGNADYHNVVDNSQASGIAIVVFLVEWCGGVLLLSTAGSYVFFRFTSRR